MLENSLLFRLSRSPWVGRLPWAAVWVVATIVLLEIFADLWGPLTNRSVMAIRYKRAMLERAAGEDIAVFGTSQVMGLDVRKLEERGGESFTAFNYAVPDLGTTLELYLVLRRYLECKRTKPRLIVCSLPAFSLIAPTWDRFENLVFERFRLMFPLEFVKRATTLPVPQWLEYRYANRRLWFPSYDLFPMLAFLWGQGDLWPRRETRKGRLLPALRAPGVVAGMRETSALYRTMVATKGMLLFTASENLSRDELLRSLPPGREAALRGLRETQGVLETFLSLAQAENIPVVFFNMPVPETFDERCRTLGYNQAIDAMFRGLEPRYRNFTYWPIETFHHWPDRDFGDYAHHLNDEGAARVNDEFFGHFRAMLDRAGFTVATHK